MDEAVKALQRVGERDGFEPQIIAEDLMKAIRFFQSLQGQVIPEEPLTF